MMYFILWVAFLVFLILSVPIVSFLEKRKRQAAFGPMTEESEAFEEAADEAEEMVAEGELEAVDETPVEGDGFAEFEEVK